jgi:hypothetical protein
VAVGTRFRLAQLEDAQTGRRRRFDGPHERHNMARAALFRARSAPAENFAGSHVFGDCLGHIGNRHPVRHPINRLSLTHPLGPKQLKGCITP